MENLVRAEYSANSWWYLCFIINLSLIYSSKINFIKYLLGVRNYLYVYTVGSRSEPLYQIGPWSFYWCWHSDDLENERSHSAEVAHLVFWMSSTPCSKSTLYPSAAHSVPQEGDLHAVHPQASFSPASSLVGQWGTQQVTEGRRRLKLECNPIYPLTHFMSEPSPHSPLGLSFQEVLLPLIPSDFREATSPSQAVSSPYPLSFVVFPLITLYIISLLNSPQLLLK